MNLWRNLSLWSVEGINKNKNKNKKEEKEESETTLLIKKDKKIKLCPTKLCSIL